MTGTNNRGAAAKPRIRATLLILLWVWAIVMFMVVDLFLNVPEFESMRPRASIYRGMRIVGHNMVGTEIEEPEHTVATVPDRIAGHSTEVAMDRAMTGGDGMIAGEVVFESGEPATYFEFRMVKGINARGGKVSDWTGISGAGNFTIRDLQPGPYRMWFRSPGSRVLSVAGVRPRLDSLHKPLRIVLTKAR